MKRVLCIWPVDEPIARGGRKAPSSAGSTVSLSGPALRELATWCEQFSPIVGLEDSPTPACLLLDVTGTAALFGGEQALLAEVEQRLAARGFRARLGLADSVGGAWALARFADSSPCCSSAALGQLPVAALRLSPACLAWLAELGLERIEQVQALPRPCLAARLGLELPRRLDQLTGLTDEVIVPHRPPPEFVVEQAFEHPTERRDVLDEALLRQLRRLTAQLSPRDAGIVRWECELRCASGPGIRLLLGLYRASNRAEYLAEMLRLRLDSLTLSQPVVGLRLAALITAPLACRQQRLFAAEALAVEREQSLAQLVDRLGSRLGTDAVLQARLCPEAQPELACRYTAWDAEPADARRRKTEALPPRPLQLAREPLAIDVVAAGREVAGREVAGREAGGRRAAVEPRVFRLHGQEQRAERCWGPERIETGWWRGRAARRDYYRVLTAEGRLWWLFRRLSDGAWFLHGWFD